MVRVIVFLCSFVGGCVIVFGEFLVIGVCLLLFLG